MLVHLTAGSFNKVRTSFVPPQNDSRLKQTYGEFRRRMRPVLRTLDGQTSSSSDSSRHSLFNQRLKQFNLRKVSEKQLFRWEKRSDLWCFWFYIFIYVYLRCECISTVQVPCTCMYVRLCIDHNKYVESMYSEYVLCPTKITILRHPFQSKSWYITTRDIMVGR